VKALSLSQPWLWAMLDPVADKGIENRDWMPPIEMIGQRIALHAAKSFDDDALPMLWEAGFKLPGEYQKSAIIGVATIDRVVTEDRTLPEPQKRWFFGKCGWVLTDRRPLPRPIPWDGALGLWTVPPLIEGEIVRQIEGDAAGVETSSAWVAAHPGEHLWFEYDGLPSCVCCGIMRAKSTAKKPQKPCRGVARIELRSTP